MPAMDGKPINKTMDRNDLLRTDCRRVLIELFSRMHRRNRAGARIPDMGEAGSPFSWFHATSGLDRRGRSGFHDNGCRYLASPQALGFGRFTALTAKPQAFATNAVERKRTIANRTDFTSGAVFFGAKTMILPRIGRHGPAISRDVAVAKTRRSFRAKPQLLPDFLKPTPVPVPIDP